MPQKGRKRIEKRSRQANWQQIKHAEGICPGCGNEKRDLNPRPGKPYYYGPFCRAIKNATKAQLMRNRRAAGLA